MKISGVVRFHRRRAQHNQSTLVGCSYIAQMLTGRIAGGITNILFCTDLNKANITQDSLSIDWNTVQQMYNPVLYASTGTPNKEFGYLSVTIGATAQISQGAETVCQAKFPRPTSPLSTDVSNGIIYKMFLIANGNTAAYKEAYKPLGSEVVMACVSLIANPLEFDLSVDNNFTWTVTISPEVGEE